MTIATRARGRGERDGPPTRAHARTREARRGENRHFYLAAQSRTTSGVPGRCQQHVHGSPARRDPRERGVTRRAVTPGRGVTVVTCPGWSPAEPCTSAIDPQLVAVCSKCRDRLAAQRRAEPVLTSPAEPRGRAE